jgi:hypothetical protein
MAQAPHEYTAVTSMSHPDIVRSLSEHEAAGWRLVTIVSQGMFLTAFFSRPVTTQRSHA